MLKKNAPFSFRKWSYDVALEAMRFSLEEENMFEWEVVFKPDKSIYGKAEEGPSGDLQVEFVLGKGKKFTTEPVGGGATRVSFYGTLKIKSIPGGSSSTSYEIPNGGMSKSK
jgi:hypothetical protein